jgi:hypothetical protein
MVKVVDFKRLDPHHCGFQLAYGTFVVLLGFPFVPEIMHGWAPEVFLHQ